MGICKNKECPKPVNTWASKPQKPDPRIPRKKHMLYFLETKIRLISHYPEQKNATYWEKLKSFQAKKGRSHYPEQKNATYGKKLKAFQATIARSQNPKKNTLVI